MKGLLNNMQITMPNGYITYILAILAILGALAGYFLGWIDFSTASIIVTQGLGIFGVRKAISNQVTGTASHW